MLNEPLISDQEQPPPPFSQSLIVYLYAGHFLARWGARMWEFSVGLYMINVWPDSLLLAAAYGVVESASTALFGPVVGQWVDRFTYDKVVRGWLLTQNLSFIIAGVSVIALLVFEDLSSRKFATFIFLIVLINVSGAVAVLSTLAGTILVEREWVVVISERQAPEMLTEMNSVIRRIDLVCKLLAPVTSGFIISFVSLTASALALSLWNVFSVCLQYWLLMSVYNGIPVLNESIHNLSTQTSDDTDDGDQSSISYIMAWKIYLKQDVVLPGIALALLYFSVLSFGTLMTATLEWEGIAAYAIGIGRGVSATIGIAATFLYPVLESRISTLRTGLWSIWSQVRLHLMHLQFRFVHLNLRILDRDCLLVCLVWIWVPNKAVGAYLLMGGVSASRLGLWMFDLSVIQQMQNQVPESDRCVVGGVQNSLQSLLDLATYLMGIIISNPQDFWKLIVISLVVVTLAATLYTIHVYLLRKHLFHFEKLKCF